MSFSLFVAKRYLLARRKQTFISIIGIFSMLGVALGVGALIVTLGIMNGFTTDLRDKILGVNAHVMLMSYNQSIPDDKVLENTVRKVPGVTGVTPFIYSEVMVSTESGVKGLVLRGIDPKSAQSVLKVLSKMSPEDMSALDEGANPDADFPGIIIGKELARLLHVQKGSLVNLLSPTGQQGAAGFSTKVATFSVAGIFNTGMFEYDASLGFISLEQARQLLGRPAGVVNGLEISVNDVYKADVIAKNILDAVGQGPYYTRDWMEMNVNLFAALKLEKTGMAIVLAIIVLVASFSIVATLIMLVMEKTRDIAVLMSLGATRKAIRNIFMLQGVIIGAIGTALGFLWGMSFAHLVTKYQFIKLPEGVYSIDHVTVLLELPDLVCIGLGAMAICFLVTLYPAYKASGLAPTEALRYE